MILLKARKMKKHFRRKWLRKHKIMHGRDIERRLGLVEQSTCNHLDRIVSAALGSLSPHYRPFPQKSRDAQLSAEGLVLAELQMARRSAGYDELAKSFLLGNRTRRDQT